MCLEMGTVLFIKKYMWSLADSDPFPCSDSSEILSSATFLVYITYLKYFLKIFPFSQFHSYFKKMSRQFFLVFHHLSIIFLKYRQILFKT